MTIWASGSPLLGVMSVHKLTAGSGYDYLTRQVAALDATEKGHTGLSTYDTERGEAPGQWVGSGLTGIDGLHPGDPVTAQQMQALFGSGHHPLSAERLAALVGDHGDVSQRLNTRDREAVTRLGAPFKVYAGDVSSFRVEVARRIAAINTDAGLPADSPVLAEQRARVRTEVAREYFVAEHGRPPRDARELAAEIARQSRPRTTTVAGYDLTFSPVKSVSALWAIAPPDIAARIERAHQGAVADALRFIETHALFTRTGRNGVRQVDVTGLVGTAFTHRDSRAGDPDLHTHVAVANKVQTLPTISTEGTPGGGGRWLSIDGRVLFKAVVTASETYNTALETRLRDDLGLRFAARESETRAEDRKRPVREIVGLPVVLLRAWSVRRADIEVRRGELAARFQRDHGRPPTPVETLHLAQQANLETRAAKHEPRTLAEQRATWQAQAEHVLGGPHRVQQMLRDVLIDNRPPLQQEHAPGVDGAWLDVAAARAVSALQARRSTWQVWHVRAEAQRQVRSTGLTRLGSERAVDALVDEVLRRHSVSLATVERDAHGQEVHEPTSLRRGDGSSVYRVAGANLYTSASVLAAEQRMVAAAGRRDGRVIDAAAVEVALLEATANGTDLNAGQVALVRQMATSGARLQLAIAPAGAGKTTAMSALAAAWTHGGGTVIGLAPSAAAAAALREHIGASSGGTGSDASRTASTDGQGRVEAETLAKLTWSLSHGDLPSWAEQIDATTLVVIDEAGMADTLSLDAAVEFVVGRGGSVRLVGDDQQLAAIGAGGVLRDIQATHGAVHLSELLRFRDPAEGAVTLALREGRTEALGFYLDHDRVHVGDLTTLTDEVFDAWLTDRSRGLDSIMLAPTHDLVSDLNQRARAHRLQTTPAGPTMATARPALRNEGSEGGGGAVVRLADGNEASAGDLLITRTNDRSLRTTLMDWVKNGDRWTLTQVHDGGSVTARHTRTGRTVVLPTAYVQASTELGYATTVHSAQGVSVDIMHGLAGGGQQGQGAGGLSRQQLYTMLTRGRLANHVYLEVVGDGDPHSVIRPDLIHPLTATDHLEVILARDDTPTSATTTRREQTDPALRLGDATARYVDALHVAAEDHLGPETVNALETAVDRVVSGLTGPQAASVSASASVSVSVSECPAWPALRAHLLLLAAAGTHPVEALERAVEKAAAAGGLEDARDVAAVLDWRLDDTGLRNAGRGPLPWLPAVPATLAGDPTWGDYLTGRADLVHHLAEQVREEALASRSTREPVNGVGPNVPPARGERAPLPAWLDAGGRRPPARVVAEVQVWRAAMQVAPADRRPTGAPQQQKAAHTWQRTLDQHVQGDRTPALSEWGHLLHHLSPALRHDPFTPVLAERLAALSRAGVDARTHLTQAAIERALPDDHAAAALWWRISRHVSPAVATTVTGPSTRNRHGNPLPTAWTTHLQQILGDHCAQTVMASRWWPALVTVIDHGVGRGWHPQDLLAAAAPPPLPPQTATAAATSTAVETTTGTQTGGRSADGALGGAVAERGEGVDGDVCLAIVWRASVLTDPSPTDADHNALEDPAPADLWEGVQLDSRHLVLAAPGAPHEIEGADAAQIDRASDASDDPVDSVAADLTVQAQLRRVLGAPEPSTMDTERALQRALDIETSPVTPERATDINELALAYFERAFPGSWAQTYLQRRFGQDLAGHPTIRPGYAPPGWTGLVRHLRQAGVSDEELLAAGVATTASTGRLIDRFRDRAILPLTHDGHVLAFVGRRHPDLTDTPADGSGPEQQPSRQHGPTYLNTATTVAYSKSAQLYVSDPTLLDQGATPVLVEGPMDAIAVTLATAGRHIGVAPLGTALSDQQAAQLAHHHTHNQAHHGMRGGVRVEPVVATDADLAGRLAAERAYWTLTLHGMDPALATLPPGSDPADLYATGGPATLTQALNQSRPLGDALIDERLAHLPSEQALTAAMAVAAARPPQHWTAAARTLSQRTDRSLLEVDRQLLRSVQARSADPRRATEAALQDLRAVRDRLQRATAPRPQQGPRSATQRWHAIAAAIDPRLVRQDDWPALAEVMDRLESPHLDIAATARTLIRTTPLCENAAQDLRYRLLHAARPDAAHDTPPPVPDTTTPGTAAPGATRPRRQVPVEVASPERAARTAARPR